MAKLTLRQRVSGLDGLTAARVCLEHVGQELARRHVYFVDGAIDAVRRELEAPDRDDGADVPAEAASPGEVLAAKAQEDALNAVRNAQAEIFVNEPMATLGAHDEFGEAGPAAKLAELERRLAVLEARSVPPEAVDLPPIGARIEATMIGPKASLRVRGKVTNTTDTEFQLTDAHGGARWLPAATKWRRL